MERVPGTTLQAQLAHFPVGGALRAQAVSRFEKTLRAVARDLADLHVKLAAGHELTTQIKENRGQVELAKLDSMSSAFPSHMLAAIRKKLQQEVIPAYVRASLPATVSHGDANLGNFVYDESTARVYKVDVGNLRQSLNPQGQGHTTGAKDVAYFSWLLRHWATPQLGSTETQRMQDIFLAEYLHAAGVAGEDFAAALRFYRVDRELEAVKLGWDSPAAALPRLCSLLGISANAR
jgi:hypothetical protein